jgi:hypothetical protein
VSRPLYLTVAALACALAVAGCGKKPKGLDLPEGVKDSAFPRTYPAPLSTDPVVKPPAKKAGPNLGPPNAGTSPDDEPLPFPTTGGIRFP